MSEEIVKAARPAAPLRQVLAWIIAGHSEPDIIDAIAEKWPSERPRPLIVKAMAEIASSSEAEPSMVKGFAIEGTRMIYQKAVDVGDHQTALRALKQLVDLSKR